MNSVKDLEQQIQELKAKLQKSEQLSTLGMLSAGIAHEVKNPLNFIINFSAMADDMLSELVDALEDRGINLEEKENEDLNDSICDLRFNLNKIKEHGHKATDIIQGVLLYSRGKSDEFMPTDISKMLKEYVWLSYHAMRANLANFNVTIREDYQADMPNIKVVPQNISRAIINLMNNACYAVWKKQQTADSSYVPTIWVKASVNDGQLSISVEDNGLGMSEEVQSQLFTAFFTTKPIGEGTGLGLSITRRIIEEEHHGSITFSSEEGKFTVFTIHIPINL